MKVTIREATPDDAPALIEQVRLLTEEPNIDIQPGPDEFMLTEEQERQVLAEYVTEESPVLLVVETEGKIVDRLNCQGGKRTLIPFPRTSVEHTLVTRRGGADATYTR